MPLPSHPAPALDVTESDGRPNRRVSLMGQPAREQGVHPAFYEGPSPTLKLTTDRSTSIRNCPCRKTDNPEEHRVDAVGAPAWDRRCESWMNTRRRSAADRLPSGLHETPDHVATIAGATAAPTTGEALVCIRRPAEAVDVQRAGRGSNEMSTWWCAGSSGAMYTSVVVLVR